MDLKANDDLPRSRVPFDQVLCRRLVLHRLALHGLRSTVSCYRYLTHRSEATGRRVCNLPNHAPMAGRARYATGIATAPTTAATQAAMSSPFTRRFMPGVMRRNPAGGNDRFDDRILHRDAITPPPDYGTA
jgi:hypothetical protein